MLRVLYYWPYSSKRTILLYRTVGTDTVPNPREKYSVCVIFVILRALQFICSWTFLVMWNNNTPWPYNIVQGRDVLQLSLHNIDLPHMTIYMSMYYFWLELQKYVWILTVEVTNYQWLHCAFWVNFKCWVSFNVIIWRYLKRVLIPFCE